MKRIVTTQGVFVSSVFVMSAQGFAVAPAIETIGSFKVGAAGRNAPGAITKPKALSYDEMVSLARKTRPPQHWFDADFSELRGPGRPKE